MINFPPSLDDAHDALVSLYCSLLERELAPLLPPGTPIFLTNRHVRFPGRIQSHALQISPESSTLTIHLELSNGPSSANLGMEFSLELRDYMPASIPCRLHQVSLNGRQAAVTVDLPTGEPAATVKKTLPTAAECQHYLESNADDLCLVLTRGSLMEPGELAPRCKDALRLLFSESERVKPVQICHEIARTLAALQSEADEHPLLWPAHIRSKAADLLDRLNLLSA